MLSYHQDNSTMNVQEAEKEVKIPAEGDLSSMFFYPACWTSSVGLNVKDEGKFLTS